MHKRFFLSRFVGLLAISLLLATSGMAQSKSKTRAAATGSCTSRTGLYCEMYGSGQPMLFIHGLGGSTYSWRYMIDPFKQNYQVILIDLRGQGKSPKPKDKNYSIIEQGRLLQEFIVEKNLRNLIIVGNSYGGGVSLLLAIELLKETPTRLAKLVLIDSGGYPDHLPLHLIILRTPVIGELAVYLIPPKVQSYIVLHAAYHDPCKITWEQVKKYAKPISDKGGRHALLQLGRQAIPADILDWIAQYPDIKVPTLILWGDDDRVLPRLIGKRLNCAIPYSELHLIKDAGHIPQEEEHTRVICQITKFLTPGTTCPNDVVVPKVCPVEEGELGKR